MGVFPLYSERWALVSSRAARAIIPLYEQWAVDGVALPYPACTMNAYGRGRVAWIPAAAARDFGCNRPIGARAFLGRAMEELAGDQIGRAHV